MDQYLELRSNLDADLDIVKNIEKHALTQLYNLINKYKQQIKEDYDSASELRPYWVNYPPDDRGRQPRGDQIPWIEVGEHSVGDNIIFNLKELGSVRFPGLPAGPDIRYTVVSDEISSISSGLLDGYWSMTDIKSVGPRDNYEHAVMSHNQVSGSGSVDSCTGGIINKIVTATGKIASHPFHCSLPPLYILPNEQALLSVTLFVKPIYTMSSTDQFSQKLDEIKIGCIPNGLLLSGSNGYLKQYPGLLYPGKDDKKKNPKKLRARVDFNILRQIDTWRVKSLQF
jgi:hypothetical protein